MAAFLTNFSLVCTIFKCLLQKTGMIFPRGKMQGVIHLSAAGGPQQGCKYSLLCSHTR